MELMCTQKGTSMGIAPLHVRYEVIGCNCTCTEVRVVLLKVRVKVEEGLRVPLPILIRVVPVFCCL